MSTIAVNAITDASGGNTASINGATPTNDNLMGRNRIINGDMRIDARNAGASVALVSGGGNTYSADRWYVENATDGTATIQQVSDAPDGFSNSIKYTVTATDASLASDQAAWIQQRIEGFNFADLLYGTASAKTVTVSFWVKSSVTGTFGVTLANSAYNRGYPASFTVNSANTWEQKTATIAGDTTGTWIGSTNGIGVRLNFGMAAGSARSAAAGSWAAATVGVSSQVNLMATNGATFYITGVQLEAGSVATSFERRQYGQELALCQRYCYVGNSSDILSAIAPGTTEIWGNFKLSTIMRSVPSVSVSGSIRLSDNYFADYTSSSVTVLSNQLSTNGGRINLSNFSGLTVGRFYAGYDNGIGGKFTFSAEL